MGVRQRTLGPPAGNFATMPVSRQMPSRWGPSHWGQSSAWAAGLNVKTTNNVMIERICIQFLRLKITFEPGRRAVRVTIDALPAVTLSYKKWVFAILPTNELPS